jgi:hypothetical protein
VLGSSQPRLTIGVCPYNEAETRNIDGPDLCLVICFERAGEDFARWIVGDEWLQRGSETDQIDDFEGRAFRARDHASLGDLRRTIERQCKESWARQRACDSLTRCLNYRATGRRPGKISGDVLPACRSETWCPSPEGTRAPGPFKPSRRCTASLAVSSPAPCRRGAPCRG